MHWTEFWIGSVVLASMRRDAHAGKDTGERRYLRWMLWQSTLLVNRQRSNG